RYMPLWRCAISFARRLSIETSPEVRVLAAFLRNQAHHFARRRVLDGSKLRRRELDAKSLLDRHYEIHVHDRIPAFDVRRRGRFLQHDVVVVKYLSEQVLEISLYLTHG